MRVLVACEFSGIVLDAFLPVIQHPRPPRTRVFIIGMANFPVEPETVDDLAPEVRLRVEQGRYDFENCATRLDHFGPIWKQDVMAAIIVTKGEMAAIAHLIGRRRQSVKDFIHRNRDILLFYTDVRESEIDEIERGAIEMAKAGDPGMMKFILTTLGKNRGFTTRVESTGPDGKPIPIESMAPKEKLGRVLESLSRPVDEG